LVLAAADAASIAAYVARSEHRLRKSDIISFPTRVDTSVFQPNDKECARGQLGLPSNACIVVTVGRLHWAKGWDLLIDAFKLFRMPRDDAHLVFVGDGQDRPKIETRIKANGLSESVHITGYLDATSIAVYLNAADIFVLGSLAEGWPTVVVEALATGKAIVSTRVSAITELVENGENGYIVETRDPHEFCNAMNAALRLDGATSYSVAKAQRYALSGLADDLGRLWPPLRSKE
jgi:glycosyltransferase involved in cell wall biosynthesis